MASLGSPRSTATPKPPFSSSSAQSAKAPKRKSRPGPTSSLAACSISPRTTTPQRNISRPHWPQRAHRPPREKRPKTDSREFGPRDLDKVKEHFMRLTKMIAGAFLISGVLLAQTSDTKQPKLKSEKEQQAVMAIFKAAEPAARITATDALITKFADTEFKGTALYIATASAEEIGDWEKTVIYGERTLEADPKSYGTMLILARGYAGRTKEFDFDKEEKLTKADKYSKSALELLKTAPKIRPDIADDQWEAQRKLWVSEAYESLGLAAGVRKKYDDAVAAYKSGLEVVPGNPNLLTRMATSYLDAKKNDEAISTANQVLASPNLNPQVKNIVENIKKRAEAAKAAK
ncbi:MAG: tetratricopeptide repeat protein [Acidobacteria bacterium]|nr:tetratricopeptide repeat protein [Acidobacteriota bacterium]